MKRALLAAFFFVVVGALLLKGAAGEAASDPSASVDNGAPRGLLAARLLLERRAARVEVLRTHDALPSTSPALLVVPPPERARWREDEVAAALARVEAGALDVLVLCDEDDRRVRLLDAWTTALGVSCEAGDRGLPTTAVGVLPGSTETLRLRREGRVRATEDVAAVPLFVDASGATRAALVARGAGRAYVFGSTTPFANDGLALDDDAAILLRLVGDRAVAFAEAHHVPRGRDALAAAAAGVGPRTALLALALLVVASLLALAPRPGDAPRGDELDELPLGAASQARALAALLARAGVDAPPPPEGRSSR